MAPERKPRTRLRREAGGPADIAEILAAALPLGRRGALSSRQILRGLRRETEALNRAFVVRRLPDRFSSEL